MRALSTYLRTFAATTLCVCIAVSGADAQQAARTISIVGRSDVTVTTPKIRLSDIAEITGKAVTEDEAVIGLKKIELGNAPVPSETLTLSAFDILQKLKEQGVNTNDLQYTFPRVISIRRASRTIELTEIESAISEYIAQAGLQTEINAIEYQSPVIVAAGEINIGVESSATTGMGRRTFTLMINAADGGKKRVALTAKVKEFKEVPVAKRVLPKGSMIVESDFAMARLNLDSVPTDVVENLDNIIGYEASRDIGNGEVLRLQKVAPPIMVQAGGVVSMKYEGAFFEATASGIALESGGIGQEIKVKNDSSKKIVSGKINQAGIVVVK